MIRPPVPPFTIDTAAQKARLAEDAWNSRDPSRVVLAYTEDSAWRNRAEFLQGHEAIVAFLFGEEKIGWFFGNQIDFETFKMTNTGIFEAHRGKGIYKKLLPAILQLLKEKGFQKV